MKVHIVNDGGLGWKTKIFNAETGEEISGVVEIEPIIAEECIRVRITLMPEKIDLISEEIQWAMYCPYCGADLDVYRKNEQSPEEQKLWIDSLGTKVDERI